jgi:hypothetical protein
MGSTRSPGGTGYGGDLGGYGIAGEMNGGAGGAGMAGYGGGGIPGIAGSGWGGGGGAAGRQSGIAAGTGSFGYNSDGRLSYSSQPSNPAAARINGYSPQSQMAAPKALPKPTVTQFSTPVPTSVAPIMNAPAIRATVNNVPGWPGLNPTPSPWGGSPGSISPPSKSLGPGMPSTGPGSLGNISRTGPDGRPAAGYRGR